MRTLSFPTLGLLIELATELFDRKTELAPLMMRCDLLQYAPGGEIRQVLQNRLAGARDAADNLDDLQAHRNLLRFTQLIVEKRANHPRGMSQNQIGELREALLADGYELTWEPTSLYPDDYTARCNIRPTDAAPIPLAAESTALEAELAARGYSDALNHYQQAAEAFSQHRYESANSQLRPALEDLVMRLAEDHTSYDRPAKVGDGKNAIAHLAGTPGLAAADGGDMLKGLWAMTHTKGSHPGRSDADEARFRLHAITAIARLLLRRFPPP